MRKAQRDEITHQTMLVLADYRTMNPGIFWSVGTQHEVALRIVKNVEIVLRDARGKTKG